MTYDEMIEVLRAHQRGEKIQIMRPANGTTWEDCTHPSWDFHFFKYRIKPKEPERRVAYFNIYPGAIVGSHFLSRKAADGAAAYDRIACVRMEYQEGQFDE